MDGFAKVLTDTDVGRLAVPTKFLSRGRAGGDELMVKDNQTQKVYVFSLSTRSQGHPKPTFTNEWGKYSKDQQLQADQVIFFWKYEDEEFYRIEVLPRRLGVGPFDKTLTASDVSQNLAVPAELLGDPCRGGGQLMVMDSQTKKMYVFLLSTPDEQYEETVFTGEWLKYSGDQQLQAGQTLYFRKNDMEEFYRIQVLRNFF